MTKGKLFHKYLFLLAGFAFLTFSAAASRNRLGNSVVYQIALNAIPFFVIVSTFWE